MKVVVDTNVFLSAVFFGGVPGRVLQAWRDRHLDFVLSVPIFNEYLQAGERLAARFGSMDIGRLLISLASSCEFVDPVPLPQQVCTDPDDDKFIACALAAHCLVIVSGDRALLRQSGYGGIAVLRPRDFVTIHLEGK
jgi:uncharacterized protein